MKHLNYIFEFLEFSDVIRLSHVCKQCNIDYIKYFTLQSNEWVISQADKYIQHGHIISAERLLRYYIYLNDISGNYDLRKRNKFAIDKLAVHTWKNNISNKVISNKVISKYISLICVYIWNNSFINYYHAHRTEIYKSFRTRIRSNIDNYSIYIPIKLYGGSSLFDDINITNITPDKIYLPSLKNIKMTKNNKKYDNKKNTYIIASIFAYICLMDRQFKLAYDIVNIINMKNNQKNTVYYLVKWFITQNIKYLELFKQSDFTFGMCVYGYELYKSDVDGKPKFTKVLEQCLKLDPTCIIALDRYINLESRIDLILHSIESNPMYIPIYISNIKLLFDNVIWGTNNILDKIDDFMFRNTNIYKKYQNNKYDLVLVECFHGINELKNSNVFITIHYLLCSIKKNNTDLIVENLILLYRLYIRNNRMGDEAIGILLYIQNNYKISPNIKSYIYQQIQLL